MKPIISPNTRIRYPEFIEIGNYSIIDDFCYISVQLKVGVHTHIASGCSIAGGKKYSFFIGDFCSLSSGVKIWCSSSNFIDDLIILPPPIDIGLNMCSGNIIIGNYCGVGTNSVIMPNNIIPEGVAIGGLSWVPANSKLEPWSVYAGIPVKKIKDRNRENVLQQVKKIKKALKI
jgi:acetyltransferase-like isoleucine patch superfamily enzyme